MKSLIALAMVGISLFGQQQSDAATATPTATPCAGLKPGPKGAYEDMNGKLNVPLPNQTALGRPTIDGIRLKARWRDIETSPGTYVWTNLDNAIAQVTSKGKKCGIEIGSGHECPAWLYSGPEIPTHAVPYVLQDGPNAGDTIPVPGDPVYISKWGSFIAAFGARYNSNQTVSFICMTGPGNHDEWNQAQGPTDTAALGNTQAKVDTWTNETKTFIDDFCAAFPNTVIIAALAKPFQNSMGFPAMIAASDYAVANHTPQFGLSFNGLTTLSNARYEPAHQIFLHWTTNPTWAQMVQRGDRANGVPVSEGLDQSLRSAVNLKIRGVEIYKADTDNNAQYNYTAPAGSTWQGLDVSGTAAGINPRRSQMLALTDVTCPSPTSTPTALPSATATATPSATPTSTPTATPTATATTTPARPASPETKAQSSEAILIR